jgi:hypothetical protein
VSVSDSPIIYVIYLIKIHPVDFIFGKTANTYIKSSVIASVGVGAITASGPTSSGVGICKLMQTLFPRGD